MQANLLLFCNENYVESISKKVIPELIEGFSFALQRVVSVTFLQTTISLNNILSNLTDNTIIAVGFSDSYCLNKIQNAVRQFYGCAPIQTNFGFLYKSNTKRCSIIDIDNFSKNNLSSLNSLYNVGEINCLKLFGLSEVEMIKKLQTIPELNYFEFTYSIRRGEIQLCFSPLGAVGKQHLADFKRNLYEKFDNYIFSDEPKSLKESVLELATIRKMRFAVVDLVQACEIEREIRDATEYCVEISPDDKNFLLSESNGAEFIFQKYDVEFIILVTGSLENPKLLVIDSFGIRKFSYSIEGDFEYKYDYLVNIILSKIFIKLRKNSLFF